ncbi:MAG: hypothetical protein ACFFD4_39155 [Candidatus Odinarchaeota archaeon]
METKAIAFTHLSIDEHSFRTAEKDGLLPEFVYKKWGDMLDAYINCKNVGLVYLFLADAYIYFVSRNIDSYKEKEEFAKLKSLEIAIEEALKESISNKHGCDAQKKFIIVGITQLQPLVEHLKELANSLNVNFERLVLGGSGELFYDCPKVIEAIIRIVRRHTNNPVLRFDQDVVVDCNSIDALINEFENLTSNKQHYFIFSGNYRSHSRANNPQMFWLNDFAVRTHFLSTSEEGKSVNDYKESDNQNIHFEIDTKTAETFISDLSSIGADPYHQPISGAGLCISPLAIVQLPPFANVGKNIIWIDDSIKRALHEGIGDIEPTEVREVSHAIFMQDRHGGPKITLKDVRLGYSSYLPRLVSGCLMRSVMLDIAKTTRAGTYSEYFITYMQKHTNTSREIRNNWKDSIESRLDSVYRLWTSPSYQTTAGKALSNFAKSALNRHTPEYDEVLEAVLENPLQDVSKLCTSKGIKPERSAAWFVADTISDLERYVQLMNIWPYIIRAVDFELRKSTPQLAWLTQAMP